MLTKMTAFLARAPALQGLSLTVGDVGPAPYTAGLWCRGITVLDRRENLLGRVTQRCRAEFTLRLCLPRTDADNAARLLDLAPCVAQHRPAAVPPSFRGEPLKISVCMGFSPFRRGFSGLRPPAGGTP